MNNRVNLSLIILGSQGSGKSSIVERWLHPLDKPCCYETIGIDVISNMIRLKDDFYMVEI